MAEWAFWGCVPFLAVALYTDTRSMRIPNWLTVSALLSGLLVHGAVDGLQGLLIAGVGAAAGFAVLLVLHVTGAVGAGDVKLFAGIGAWTGTLFTLQVVVYSVLIGALIGWVIVLRRKETGRRIRTIFGRLTGILLLRSAGLRGGDEAELLKFPFMVAVLPGSVCAYLYY
ncbi:prepilin peptidase [Paenibacillus albidus]|uniref:A24 family peptidase n=1 Tax=Paenibacillus albidus TaxID=2041023 RepID=UPI001BEA961D|nr:A24 family peptidase [Paenibacillus albidus]MBT2292341.1 prepilin peptidase [Paenibacillus albidus]